MSGPSGRSHVPATAAGTNAPSRACCSQAAHRVTAGRAHHNGRERAGPVAVEPSPLTRGDHKVPPPAASDASFPSWLLNHSSLRAGVLFSCQSYRLPAVAGNSVPPHTDRRATVPLHQRLVACPLRGGYTPFPNPPGRKRLRRQAMRLMRQWPSALPPPLPHCPIASPYGVRCLPRSGLPLQIRYAWRRGSVRLFFLAGGAAAAGHTKDEDAKTKDEALCGSAAILRPWPLFGRFWPCERRTAKTKDERLRPEHCRRGRFWPLLAGTGGWWPRSRAQPAATAAGRCSVR